MRGKLKILLIILLALIVAGVACVSLLVPFRTTSEIEGYHYRVSQARLNWYLWANEYKRKVSEVDITLVATPQTGFRVTGGNGQVVQSFSAEWASKGQVAMKVQYDLSGEHNYARDLYMYLCLGLASGSPNPKDCYARADEQLARERWLPGQAVRVEQSKAGWRLELVKRAHAQSCNGTIACGGWVSEKRCGGTGADCTQNSTICGFGVSCESTGNYTCNESLNGINCKTLTDQTSCELYGYVSNCYTKCNNSVELFCSWGGTGGGGSCPPECRQGNA